MSRKQAKENKNMAKVSIFIADDHPIIRDGLRGLFYGHRDYAVIGEAEDAMKALTAIEKTRPDIVIMDISMPGMDGLEATERITKEFPETKVIAFSIHDEEQYAVDAFRAGAMGYVLKGSDPSEVLASVEKVLSGERYASPAIASRLLSGFVNLIQSEQSEDPFDTLTPREKEILKLVADGAKNKEIADKLFISPHTVKSHRGHIMSKLDVHDMAGLMKVAIRKQLIEG